MEETLDVARFVVCDEASAAWAVSKINEARAVLNQREQAAAEWVEEARREVRQLEERFSAELQAWAGANLPRDRKSFKLRSGTLAFRTTPSRFAVTNPDMALTWAKQFLPDAVKVQEQVSASALIAYAQTGEVPQGVERIPERETFTIG